jgi:hypothetical protein
LFLRECVVQAIRGLGRPAVHGGGADLCNPQATSLGRDEVFVLVLK